MAEAIDRAQRRKLISQAAERHWRRQGVPPGGPNHLPACPTCGAWPGDGAASRLPHEHLAAPGRAPGRLESGAAAGQRS